MCKVSVIVPVYNTQEYLKRCLDSIINQTLKDIEIICVDDYSSDNSFEILNSYKEEDNRIKILKLEENKGVSFARNRGIDIACGEYIAFVDSDDFIDLDFCEKLYKKAIEEKADISKGQLCSIDETGKKKINKTNESIRENNSKWFFIYGFFTALYKKSFIENIRFPQWARCAEDIHFLYNAILKSNKISLVDDVSYYYARRENSSDSCILSFKKIENIIKVYNEILKSISKLDDDFKNNVGISYFCTQLLAYMVKLITRNNDEECMDYCIEKTFEFYDELKNNNIIIRESAINQFVFEYIKTKDKEKLKEFFRKNNTENKILLSQIRGLMKKRIN